MQETPLGNKSGSDKKVKCQRQKDILVRPIILLGLDLLLGKVNIPL